MRDVADRAGVSPKTVSRVVNAEPGVTERTQARLFSAIGELGYRRNEAARALLRTWTASQDRSALLCSTNHVALSPGDAMLVPVGLPHAIDPGLLLVELQEPTDFSVLLEWEGFAADGDELRGPSGPSSVAWRGSVRERSGARCRCWPARRCSCHTTPANPRWAATSRPSAAFRPASTPIDD
jgi:Bacterial regulatory proteins, lacI family